MQSAANTIGRFHDDRKGGVAIIFSFSIIMIIGAIALAIDGGRVYHMQSRTSAALDAASLAAARALFETNMNDAEIQDLATKFFESNLHMTDNAIDVGPLAITIDRTNNRVEITATPHVKTYFAAVMGVDYWDISASSASTYALRDIEMGLMLDVTGSMNSGGKLDDLKAASKDLVDILIPAGGSANSVRIGLAPYSAAVNAGPYASAVTDGISVDGCVYERSGGHAYRDTLPGPGKWLGAAALPAKPADIDPTEGTGSYVCPNAIVQPITDNRDLLKTTIDSYNAGGWTAGHLGTAWAWYLVSPEWAPVWPADSAPVAYGTNRVIKTVVLMTDGILNTSYENDDSANQALALCDEMRDSGVIVYAVAFQAPLAAQNTLNDCASTDNSGGKLFYDAQNGDDLRAAFRDIAIKLTNLRLEK